MELLLHARTSPGLCPYCREDVNGERRTCPDCAVEYHLDCAALLARCGTLGCGGSLSQSESPPGWRRLLSKKIDSATIVQVSLLVVLIESVSEGSWRTVLGLAGLVALLAYMVIEAVLTSSRPALPLAATLETPRAAQAPLAKHTASKVAQK